MGIVIGAIALLAVSASAFGRETGAAHRCDQGHRLGECKAAKAPSRTGRSAATPRRAETRVSRPSGPR